VAVSPKKSSLAADNARKSGISNPIVNFGKFDKFILYYL